MIWIFAVQHSEDGKSIRSQMLYPLSYERRHCSILHREHAWYLLAALVHKHSDDRASDFLIH